jgi:GNAT superfamily N-acetyltransferase
MTQPALIYHTLTGLTDPFLTPWLDLYETGFVPAERVLVSTILNLLRNGSTAPDHQHILQAALAEEQRFAGMLWYELLPAEALACLWCLATSPEMRNLGYGTQMYREVVRQAGVNGCRALVFEVEIPALAESEADRQLAQRRIGFYRRNGAHLLTGIHYLQVVGWHQPPLPMHVMVHPLPPQAQSDPQAAFDQAKALFGEQLSQTGPLGLE